MQSFLGASPRSTPRTVPTASNWARRRDVLLVWILALILIGMVGWLAAHIVRALLVIIIAALLAYALAPAVKLVQHILPRPVAIMVVYLLVLGGLGTLLYFVIATAIQQLVSLRQDLGTIQSSPLFQLLHQWGVSQQQIDQVTQQLVQRTQGLTDQILPVLFSTANAILDTILILVISVYLLLDGERLAHWSAARTPLRQQEQVTFVLATLQRVVGGYIRGQVILAVLIGVLVGGGMALFHVPYAVLLGALAFVFEFIPVLGTIFTGVLCVALAATQGLGIAIGVLVYFIVVHVLEGDIVGPRIVGRAIGVHPAVSLFALLAGSEVFGIWGALFAAPVAGVVQAFVAAVFLDWRAAHKDEYPTMSPTEAEVVTAAADQAQSDATT